MQQREHPSVQELAYLLWEARGRPHGSAEQDWRDAERQFAAARTPQTPTASQEAGAKQATSKALDDTLKGSFPASDPPAAHLPDEPPINADEKWKAAGRTRTGSRQKTPAKPAGPAQTGVAPAKAAAAQPNAAAVKPPTHPAPAAKNKRVAPKSP